MYIEINVFIFTASRYFYLQFKAVFCYLKHPHLAEVLLYTMAHPCGHLDAKLQIIKVCPY